MVYRKAKRLTVRKLILPLYRSKHSVHYTALGAGVGMAIAMTPLVGVQMPLTLAVWLVMKNLSHRLDFNLPVAIAYNWVSNVFTLAPIYYVFMITGRLMMGDWTSLTGFDEFSQRLSESLSAGAGFWEAMYVYSVKIFEVFGVPMFVGCVPWALFLGWLTYITTFRLVTKRREKKAADRAARMARAQN